MQGQKKNISQHYSQNDARAYSPHRRSGQSLTTN